MGMHTYAALAKGLTGTGASGIFAPRILAHVKLAPSLSGAHTLADTSCAWRTTARCILT